MIPQYAHDLCHYLHVFGMFVSIFIDRMAR